MIQAYTYGLHAADWLSLAGIWCIAVAMLRRAGR